MTWQIYALISILLFTTMNIVQRKVAVDSQSPRASAIAFTTAGSIFALILFLTTSHSVSVFSLPRTAILLLILATLTYGIFERGRFVAAKLLDASVFTTIVNISVLVSFVLSILFLSEQLTVWKGLGVLTIFSSLILVSYSKTRTSVSMKGVLIASVISVFLGIAWTVDKKATLFFDSSLYALLLWTLPVLVIAFPHISLKSIQNEFALSGKGIFLMAGLNVFAYYAQLEALRFADATVVLPIIQLSSLTTVLAGILILREKEHMFKKIAAGILGLIGVYLLM